jgi:non-specific serine/threonine protein kinase
LPNLRAALIWLRETEEIGRGLRLVAALWTFWVVRDHVPEARRWLEELLAMAPGESPERLKALVAFGDMSERQGDYAAATVWTEEAVALARTLGDRSAEAAALRGLGNVSMARGEVAIQVLDDPTLADAEFARAQACLEQSAALARQLGDEWGAAKAAHWLAIAIGARGNRVGAISYFEDAIATWRRLGDLRQLCLALWNVGGAVRELGDLPRARASLAESLLLAQRLGYRWHAGLCLVALASVAGDCDDHERAAWLLGAAEALREATGKPLRPVVQAVHDRTAATARAKVGEAAFADVWAAAAAKSTAELIAETLAWTAAVPMSPEAAPSPTPDVLTPREVDVLRLVAAGRSDRAIADALFISRRTASKHVAAILAKLGVASRAEAAAHAVRDGLV